MLLLRPGWLPAEVELPIAIFKHHDQCAAVCVKINERLKTVRLLRGWMGAPIIRCDNESRPGNSAPSRVAIVHTLARAS